LGAGNLNSISAARDGGNPEVRRNARENREVELRRVAAARHVTNLGVVGVDDGVEQFTQAVAAWWLGHFIEYGGPRSAHVNSCWLSCPIPR
jgi:hypothetical protein